MSNAAHRYFFALLPSPVCGSIASHRDQLGAVESKVDDHCLHATLAITDDFDHQPASLEAQLLAIGEGIATGPVPMALDQLSGTADSVALRPSRRIPALAVLAGSLQRRMARAGLLRTEWTFRPHVTLLYRKGKPFARPLDPICWTATDFVLIHSIVDAHQHVELGRWPLIERQGSFAF